MKFATVLYNNIASRKKVIESRLFDEKRQQISIGDTITLSENDRPEHQITVTVVGLLRYQTFKELFANHDPMLFGNASREYLLHEVRQFYIHEDEQKYGVVGIYLQVL